MEQGSRPPVAPPQTLRFCNRAAGWHRKLVDSGWATSLGAAGPGPRWRSTTKSWRWRATPPTQPRFRCARVAATVNSCWLRRNCYTRAIIMSRGRLRMMWLGVFLLRVPNVPDIISPVDSWVLAVGIRDIPRIAHGQLALRITFTFAGNRPIHGPSLPPRSRPVA